MKFGLMSANLMGNVEGIAAAELARTAEEVGFHSIWAVEHAVVPVQYASTYPYDEGGRLFKGTSQLDHSDPLIWLAFAAAATSTIRLATGILILPQRNPLIAAKEIASLDRLSNGRLDLGIGVGWLREEFDALGVPFEARGARTDEYVQALRVLWSETEAEFHGEFVDFAPVYCQPKPTQQPIPILVGGHSDRAARRAGELGDVFFPAERPIETLTDLYSRVKEYAEKAGRDPALIELWTSSTGDRDHLDQLVEAGVSQVMVPARPPEQLGERYSQLIVDYDVEGA
ncbi:MAG: LLM class F420-dependent oxidoreductase [Acidimicrobiaceae bacterium]|nr:LLM class F420-dependent oxidoreductase [Acidimicrobiaceae bacterium]|tara:strand:- start:5181 stop:6038 length:858 start_codon:yes stop_codon:yes gene_type:complete